MGKGFRGSGVKDSMECGLEHCVISKKKNYKISVVLNIGI